MPVSPLTYVFRPDEKARAGFARILGEISARARDLPRLSLEPVDELIHEGRLLIKRARALLWFARPVLGPAAYTRGRERLRKAAELLAAHRDLAVTQATLERLAGKASKTPNQAAMTQLFQSLAGDLAAGETPEAARRKTLEQAMDILHRAAAGIKRSAAGRIAWPSASGRVAEAFRAARQAGKKARRTGKDADFHAWRKKAKRLLYQLELTQAEPGRRMARIMKRIGKLQETLGTHQDGVMAAEHLGRMLPLSSSARCVLGLLEKRKSRLRRRAWKIARQQ
ncbi:MAG TPA: CHAD domain-containing protein [Candidatus Methylacidiphilales bacterium]|jgi:CHAD domain-containing protein|nr:CHAD domain-containing protein [Candidatus Methylacidiphilales bacterium]